MTSIFKEESGQGMVEYSLIIALVALLAIGGLKIFGKEGIGNMYNDISQEVFDHLDVE